MRVPECVCKSASTFVGAREEDKGRVREEETRDRQMKQRILPLTCYKLNILYIDEKHSIIISYVHVQTLNSSIKKKNQVQGHEIKSKLYVVQAEEVNKREQNIFTLVIAQ